MHYYNTMYVSHIMENKMLNEGVDVCGYNVTSLVSESIKYIEQEYGPVKDYTHNKEVIISPPLSIPHSYEQIT